MTATITDLTVLAVDPDRLAAMRTAGVDEQGNLFTGYPAKGWEPLRCCLRIARPEEQIALIGYRRFETVSPWAEVGPVYVHAEPCEGTTPMPGCRPNCAPARASCAATPATAASRTTTSRTFRRATTSRRRCAICSPRRRWSRCTSGS